MHDDDMIDEKLRRCTEMAKERGTSLKVDAAIEGTAIEIDPLPLAPAAAKA